MMKVKVCLETTSRRGLLQVCACVSLLRLVFFAVVAQRKLTTLLLRVVALPVHHTLLIDDRLQHTHTQR